jgi:hypothetical protein
MKESFWGVFLVTIGVIGIGLLNAFQDIVTTGQHDYYLLREVTEGAMYDSIDLGHYRRLGEIRIIEEKFIENFLRRFSESFGRAGDREIVFYHINEMPPKVSIGLDVGFNVKVYNFDDIDFNIGNNIIGILESKFRVDAIEIEPSRPGAFLYPPNVILTNSILHLNWGSTQSWGNPSDNPNYRLEVSCDNKQWEFVANTGTSSNAQHDVSCATTMIQYRVRAESTAGESNWSYSPIIQIVNEIAPEMPGPFTSPVSTTTINSGTTINIAWGNTPSWGKPDTEKRYVLEVRRVSNDGRILENWNAIYTGLTINVQYFVPASAGGKIQFRVKAVSDGGESLPRMSDEVNIIFTEVNHTFNMLEREQTFTVPETGLYRLEVWGAEGSYGNESWGGNRSAPGRGGYARGEITLNKGETVIIRIGGQAQPNVGGWNGGGTSTSSFAGSGGGATDIRRGGTGLANRIIVAGGGGGGADSPPRSELTLHGGTSNPGTTTLGQGADGGSCIGAGGGGYYGGAKGTGDHASTSPGRGGSSYVGALSNTYTALGCTAQTGNGRSCSGHGYAIITLISN